MNEQKLIKKQLAKNMLYAFIVFAIILIFFDAIIYHQVSTYMYKIEILNTIALAIKQEIEKKDIFVLDKAYKLNGKYNDFSEIDLNTLAINSVYAIGKPVSMEPNQDLVEIKYLFESLHKVNKILPHQPHTLQ